MEEHAALHLEGGGKSYVRNESLTKMSFEENS